MFWGVLGCFEEVRRSFFLAGRVASQSSVGNGKRSGGRLRRSGGGRQWECAGKKVMVMWVEMEYEANNGVTIADDDSAKGSRDGDGGKEPFILSVIS